MFGNIRQLLCSPRMTSSIHWPHLNYQRSHSHHRNGSVLRYNPHWHRQNPYDYRSPALQKWNHNKTAKDAQLPWLCPHHPHRKLKYNLAEDSREAARANQNRQSGLALRHELALYHLFYKFAKNLKGAICRLISN